MRRVVLPVILCLAAFMASAGVSLAAGGLLARMNKSVFPTAPGLPTASPLGLVAPRLSNLVSFGQFGGMRTTAGRMAGLGLIAPRVSPFATMMRMPLTPATRRMAFLTIISPRATALVGMLKGMRTFAGGLR
jgi:hypothetical protein